MVAQRSLDFTVQGPVRHVVGSILGDGDESLSSASADPRVPAAVAFTEQFVVDVAGITEEQRGAMVAAMGADSLSFVQVLYVCDVFSRARIGLGRVFDTVYVMSTVPVDQAEDLWTLLERFMQRVAQLSALDPLTTELVRLRGARIHNCRLCQSRLSVSALDAAGGSETTVFDDLDDYEHSQFPERHKVALRLTDALVTQPNSIDAMLAADVRRQFSVAEITEIVLDVARNAANKIAVAFGADAPVASEGVEFYDIDASGGVVADVDIEAVRAATAR